MMTIDGYIRISKVNGRNGDAFLSPHIQREAIERLAAAKGFELGEIVEEYDVSGGKKIRERQLGRLVDKVEAGQSAGLIVWRVSRFARDLQDCVETANRVTNAGGRFISEDVDSTMPYYLAMLGFLAGLAEEQLNERRTDFASAREKAIARGVPTGAVPTGYKRAPDGRLVVDQAEAKKVQEAFAMRAAGRSLREIGKRFGWSHAPAILQNDTYLGGIRSGEFVNEQAHDPIIDRELFETVNRGRSVRLAPAGETTASRLLVGLARCAGCGATLKVTRRKDRNGKQQPDVYYCRDAKKDSCSARALVCCDVLDAYVAAEFGEALATNDAMVDAVEANRELDLARAEEREAREELEAFEEFASARDRAKFQRGYDARLERLTAAQERVREAETHVARLPEGGSALGVWASADAEERRLILSGWLDRVAVARGASGNLAGHVRIVWMDGAVANDEADARMAAA